MDAVQGTTTLAHTKHHPTLTATRILEAYLDRQKGVRSTSAAMHQQATRKHEDATSQDFEAPLTGRRDIASSCRTR
jgi:hypothetical protein